MHRADNFILNPNHPQTKHVRLALFGKDCHSGVVVDSSLYGQHGSLVNIDGSAYAVSQDIHRPAITIAATLDTSPQHVAIPFDGSLVSQTKFSVAWWAYAGGSTTAGYSSTAAWFGCGNYKIYTDLSTYANAGVESRFYMGVELGAQLTANRVFLQIIGERDSGWHHYAIVRDGTTFHYFFDGLWTRTLTGQLSSAFVWSDINLGCHANNSASNQYNGQIADFLIVDDLLTASTVADLANPYDPMCGGFLTTKTTDDIIMFGNEPEEPEEPTPQRHRYKYTVVKTGSLFFTTRKQLT